MIGILCGLRHEAKIADRLPDVLVACSAARPDRALALARHLAGQGARRLISFGFAAGLSQDLVAGDLVLGGSVMTARNAWEADGAWSQALVERLPSALCVPVWGSQNLLTSAQSKEIVYRRTGCLIADMESQFIARAAQEARIPFNIVRAVSDTHDMDLPPAALVPLKEDGRVDCAGVYRAVKKQPAQIGDLIALGLSTSRASRSLRQAVQTLKAMG